MTFENSPSRARRIPQQFDTIISTVRTYLKAITYIENKNDNLIVSTGFGILHPLDIINSKFLYYFIRIHYFIENVMKFSVGVSYPAINSSDLACIKCLLPPNDLQENIVKFLDKKTIEINQIIADKGRMVELFQEYRQAVISEAVMKGLDPNAEMKDSGIEWIGEIPKHWKLMRLKFLTKKPFKYGANESSNIDDPSFPRYIRITDLDEYGNLRNETFSSLPIEKAKSYLLNDGDLLFARSGATVGKTLLYKREYGHACYAGYLIKFVAYTDKLIPDFLFYYTLSNEYNNWIELTLIQATIQNVSADKYKNLWIPLPTLHDQRIIIKYLDQKISEIDSLISNIKSQIEDLNDYHQSLISEVLTGKIDVRNYNLNNN